VGEVRGEGFGACLLGVAATVDTDEMKLKDAGDGVWDERARVRRSGVLAILGVKPGRESWTELLARV
jgi:hypothetical protein